MKIRDHQQVNEDDRENQPFAEGDERIVHSLALAADYDVSAGGQRAEVVDLMLNSGGDAAEIAAGYRGVDVDHALHGVVCDDGGIPGVPDIREVAQHLRLALSSISRGRAEREIR